MLDFVIQGSKLLKAVISSYLLTIIFDAKCVFLTAKFRKLKTHVLGVIVHGIMTVDFFDYNQYSHASNLTIHAFLHSLIMLSSIPDILYLQLDNGGRENNNR